MTEHEMRLIIQQYDCTYGDNPLLIHCPIDMPCMKHKYENLHQKLLEETQTKGVECDKCGWAMKFPDEPCRCELEEENKKLLDILSDARETLMSQHDSEDVNIMLHRIYEVLGYEE